MIRVPIAPESACVTVPCDQNSFIKERSFLCNHCFLFVPSPSKKNTNPGMVTFTQSIKSAKGKLTKVKNEVADEQLKVAEVHKTPKTQKGDVSDNGKFEFQLN